MVLCLKAWKSRAFPDLFRRDLIVSGSGAFPKPMKQKPGGTVEGREVNMLT